MVTVRGINIYPGALDNIVRGHPSIEEYEVHIRTDRAMDQLFLKVEVGGAGSGNAAEDLVADIHNRLQVRPTVEVVESGSLPRYELKSRRFRGRTDDVRASSDSGSSRQG